MCAGADKDFNLCEALLFQSENSSSSSLCMQGICYWNALSFTPPLSLFSLEKPIEKSHPHPHSSFPSHGCARVEFLQRTWSLRHNRWKAYCSEVSSSLTLPRFYTFRCLCCAPSLCAVCGGDSYMQAMTGSSTNFSCYLKSEILHWCLI